MDRLKSVGIPMLGLVAVATAVVLALPGRDANLPRTQAGAQQAAATEAGALANLCAGWGNARRDCAAFVGHYITALSEAEPALKLCLPPPAPLAEWTVVALNGAPPDRPWAPVLHAALTAGGKAHPLPCTPAATPPAG
jgi:hypothetical protein